MPSWLIRLSCYIGLLAGLITILSFLFPQPTPLASRVIEYLRKDMLVVTPAPMLVVETTPAQTPRWHLFEDTDPTSGKQVQGAYTHSQDGVARVSIDCWPDDGIEGFHVWISWGKEDFMDRTGGVEIKYQFKGDDPTTESWREVEQDEIYFLVAPDDTETSFAQELARSTELQFRATSRKGAYRLAHFQLDPDARHGYSHPVHMMMRACQITD